MCLCRLLTLLTASAFKLVLCMSFPNTAASTATLRHVPLSGLLTLLPGPECVMGPCTASHCC
ncbi:unnamed protein product [Staurois parvus]|uniref:Uncharacterized protein n=1 Tax=Staurois parvus TaxID=386267 RepID=A0ABN9HS23_9NEOB|nr:unnamed protein product [Staurois parvus]